MRQKLISGDISPDPGAAFAISSNSAAPSTKAYCPLMGNLQTEFDFFIKNQQAVDEEESPGPSQPSPPPSRTLPLGSASPHPHPVQSVLPSTAWWREKAAQTSDSYLKTTHVQN